MRLLFLPLALLGFLLTSCLENSVVVKIHKDGSGLIHIRKHSKNSSNAEDVEMPTDEELAQAAAGMGPQVKLVSAKKGTNPQGWHGYEVIYEFPDINKLTLRNKDNQQGKDNEPNGMSATSFEFSMKDGVLEVISNSPEWDNPKTLGSEAFQTEGTTIDPFAHSQKGSAQKIGLTSTLTDQDKIMRAASKDMRIGYFIQPADPVKSTNALYQKDGLITLFRLDVEKLYREGTPDFDQFNGLSREEFAERVAETDGLDFDLQKPILIDFE
ncbi:hypothetical protein [Roseibacillus persicicus]|uniref:hypothetical protein n=1 Tax=Roseibacillus persicicus TaxID=454148 RepID=UPI00280F303B|nr:hypothetical protein [Roseibacillus persicicus]MDQ8190580.1 hypothetical protein [Roseibacillus persicicus]